MLLQVDVEHLYRFLVGVEQTHLELLLPCQVAAIGVELPNDDAIVFVFGGDEWQTFLFHPCGREVVDGGLRGCVSKDMYEVIPRCIAVCKGEEVVAYAFLESLFAHLLFQFAHHYGCLAVDDVTIEQAEEPRLNSSHANISYAVFCLK